MSDTVIVEITNAYACGRHSGSVHALDAPPGVGEEALERWFNDVVHDLTGDGHPCGSRENAYYEAEIIESAGRPELVGEFYSWGG